MTAIRGRVGEVVFKTYGRKIIVTRVPCFDGYMPSAAQRTRRDRMREATAYAKRVYADAAAKALYVAAAKKLGRQPFRLAVSDYLNGYDRFRAAPPVNVVSQHQFGAARPRQVTAISPHTLVNALRLHAEDRQRRSWHANREHHDRQVREEESPLQSEGCVVAQEARLLRKRKVPGEERTVGKLPRSRAVRAQQFACGVVPDRRGRAYGLSTAVSIMVGDVSSAFAVSTITSSRHRWCVTFA